jgi:hypothetical protein
MLLNTVITKYKRNFLFEIIEGKLILCISYIERIFIGHKKY